MKQSPDRWKAGLARKLAEYEEAFNEQNRRVYRLSYELASRDFGVEVIAAAMAAMGEAPRTTQVEIADHDHPYGALVTWFRGATH